MRNILIGLCLSESISLVLPIYRLAYPFQKPVSIEMYSVLTAQVLVGIVAFQLIGFAWRRFHSYYNVHLLLSCVSLILAIALIPSAASIVRMALSGLPSDDQFRLLKTEELSLSRTIGIGVVYAILHSIVIFMLVLRNAIQYWARNSVQFSEIGRKVTRDQRSKLIGLLVVCCLASLFLPFAKLPVVGKLSLLDFDLVVSSIIVLACAVGIWGIVIRQIVVVLLCSMISSIAVGYIYFRTSVLLNGLDLVFTNQEWGIIGSLVSISLLTSGFGVGMLFLISQTLVLLAASALMESSMAGNEPASLVE